MLFKARPVAKSAAFSLSIDWVWFECRRGRNFMESIPDKEELHTDLSALRERIGTVGVAGHGLWCCRLKVTFNSSSYS